MDLKKAGRLTNSGASGQEYYCEFDADTSNGSSFEQTTDFLK